MKKTILALAVTSLFSVSAMAEHHWHGTVEANDSQLDKFAAENNLRVMKDSSGVEYLIGGESNELIGQVTHYGDMIYVKNSLQEDVFRAKIDQVTGDAKVTVIDGDDQHRVFVKRINEADRNNDQNGHIDNRNAAMAKGLDDALNHVTVSGDAVEVNGVTYSNEDVREAANAFAEMSKQERAAVVARLEYEERAGNIKDVKIVDGESNDDSRNNDIIAIDSEVDARISEAGAAAYKDAAAYATATDAKLANHESRIGSLENQMKDMGNKMLVLEDRMDGVVASSHAITNARPVLNSAGQFGMGMGVGAAGSKQAIAIGGAYQITDNWSGTMSVNYETKGKVSSHQVSAGVGAQYIF
ncbi:YadA C-terminal domain-containing protein [Vibrio makurazakiensis]|uniref:YadA C-terminal domain-containing protein n=1 Tax=Vibrio makurazakiensis TaxID=2910250 RepID=UPI003D104EBF